MDKNVERYCRVRINFAVGLPLPVIDNIKSAAYKSKITIRELVENALLEYFIKHDLLDDENPDPEASAGTA